MTKTSRTGDTVLGFAYLGLILLVVLACVLAYNQVFQNRVEVQLTTGTVGNALQTGSEVKMNGVHVGEVTAIDATEDGALVTLALLPEVTDAIPHNVSARLVPKTLFGERYVDLMPPQFDTGQTIRAGDQIGQDDSSEAVEIEELFDELLPVLEAVQPEKLSATLNEFATMLRGQGETIGATMDDWQAYLDRLTPLVPEMAENLGELGDVAQTWSDASPELLEALDDLTVTMGTFVDERDQLRALFDTVATSSGTTADWNRRHEDVIVVLSRESRQALGAAAPYATSFPCLLESLHDFIPVMDDVLGAGTDQPGARVTLSVVPARSAYQPGSDTPTFARGGSASCPNVPGGASTPRSSGGSPPPVSSPRTASADSAADQAAELTASDGMGSANSPAENALLAEIFAPDAGIPSADFPSWGSLLLGPGMRDAEVFAQIDDAGEVASR